MKMQSSTEFVGTVLLYNYFVLKPFRALNDFTVYDR